MGSPGKVLRRNAVIFPGRRRVSPGPQVRAVRCPGKVLRHNVVIFSGRRRVSPGPQVRTVGCPGKVLRRNAVIFSGRRRVSSGYRFVPLGSPGKAFTPQPGKDIDADASDPFWAVLSTNILSTFFHIQFIVL